jgi:hypothetical protein
MRSVKNLDASLLQQIGKDEVIPKGTLLGLIKEEGKVARQRTQLGFVPLTTN